jgi:aminopeptidase N
MSIRAALLAALLLATPAVAQTPRVESAAATLQSGRPLAPEQAAVTLDVADLAIKVLPETRAIEAVATLTLTATAPVERLVVDLDERFAIAEVAVDGVALAAGDGWGQADGRLWARLATTLPAGASATLRIAYSGHPRVAPNAPWDGGFVWSTAPSGEPWIATAVQGEGCDLFWPCIDSALSEPGRVDLHITVPSNLSAPSNGRFLGTVDHGDGWTTWNWSARTINPYAVALTIGPYDKVEATYDSRFGNSFPMQYWHLRSDDPDQVAALFAQFAPMLDFFEATIGPYPFADEKMGVVETPHLGMEHQTINAYGNGYRIDLRGYDWLLQHELAHEWFGNQMTHANIDDFWLHEGLGTYMQPLYARWLHGDRYMEIELGEMHAGLANIFPVVTGEDIVGNGYFEGQGPGNDTYFKGALVAHTLRMLIGDEAFFRSLRVLVYGRPDPQPGNFTTLRRSTRDFVRIVEAETGQELSWFFEAYLLNGDLPVLSQSREGDRLTLSWRVSGYSAGVPFRMPVEVEVDGVVTTLPMTDGRGEIVVPAHASVLIDPENKVLRRLELIETYRASRNRPN